MEEIPQRQQFDVKESGPGLGPRKVAIRWYQKLSLRVLGRRQLLAFYVLAIVAPFVLDHLVEFTGDILGINFNEVAWIRPFIQPGFLYQKLALAGYRHPRAHFVVLIKFAPDKEPDGFLEDPCPGRALEARLLEAISTLHPALVVLDESFHESPCEQHDTYYGTPKLRNAIYCVATNGIPIVIGWHTESRDDQAAQDLPKKDRVPESDLILDRGVDFSEGIYPSGLLSFGLTRLDFDPRRVPLSWSTFASEEDFKAGKRATDVPTLSFQAARMYDRSPTFQARLNALSTSGIHPFTSFLREDQFVSFEALDLICGGYKPENIANWSTCSSENFGSDAIRGRIILVGDRTPDEMRESVMGFVPGFVLQANYIEGLLDDRLLIPAILWIRFAASLLLFGLIESIFRILSDQPIKALLLALFLIVFSWLVCYVLVLSFGYFLDLWIPGFIAVLGEFINLLTDSQHNRDAQIRSATA